MAKPRQSNIVAIWVALLSAGIGVSVATLPAAASREPASIADARHDARRACGMLLDSEPPGTAEARFQQCMNRIPLDGDLNIPAQRLPSTH